MLVLYFMENEHSRRLKQMINVYKGTTTVGLRYTEGVVLATDRRVTSGYFIAHRRGKKILKIDDHVAVTIAGAVGDAQKVVDELRAEARLYKFNTGRPIRIRTLASLASVLLFSARPYVYIVQMIVGGVDDIGSALYTIDWFGTVTEEKYIATGSGTPIALGILESEYKPDMSTDSAVKLAVKAVNAAMKVDPGSGEGIDVAIVDKEGVRELTDEVIASYV